MKKKVEASSFQQKWVKPLHKEQSRANLGQSPVGRASAQRHIRARGASSSLLRLVMEEPVPCGELC